MLIQNPVLKGFNPDPSIVAVDNDFYIATSTFEWFPGVQIHHSKDLVNWSSCLRFLLMASRTKRRTVFLCMPLCLLTQVSQLGLVKPE
ncbi:MAG: family 43 glycosylhydrolase [Lentisphaeria bacterium]